MSKVEELRQRYHNLCHAMQTGVAFKMENDPSDTSPKHLRVGVNSAMVETSTLTRLLIQKGVITEEEFYEMLCTVMEQEVELYKRWLSERFGAEINLL